MINFDDVRSIPAFTHLYSDGYDVTAIYPYTSPQGDVLYWRARFDHPTNGKTIRPFYKAAGDALVAGEPNDIKRGFKPLYGLHLLTQYPTAHVWIVEGEKCADVLNAFFERYGESSKKVALTSGSATSADKADWQPLEGRSVTIWPDNDTSGTKYAADVTAALEALGCKVDCIDVGGLGLGDGEDCAEWLDFNPTATIADVLALPKQQPAPPDNEMRIICMSDIDIKPIEWLWPNRIACGKLTVIAGNPGLGKSQITASLAAIVTTGGTWPDRSEPPAIGNVIFLSAEDDAADTIKPRLVAANADIGRCHILDMLMIKNDNGEYYERSFDLTQDIERLGQAIARLGNVKLAVIDPISAYLGSIDSHNNADIRGLLAPLASMAAKYGVAIILLTHLNKSTHQDVIGRVIGSIGLIAAARAGYIVMKDEKNPETRYFIPIKNNIGNDHDGFLFNIESVELANDIMTSKIHWHEGLVDAQKMLHPEPEEKSTATNGAVDFLRKLLSNKPMMKNDVIEEAEGAGYSKTVLQRAATKLTVKRKKLGMSGGWQWSLPKLDMYGQAIEDVEDSNHLSEVSSAETMQPT